MEDKRPLPALRGYLAMTFNTGKHAFVFTTNDGNFFRHEIYPSRDPADPTKFYYQLWPCEPRADGCGLAVSTSDYIVKHEYDHLDELVGQISTFGQVLFIEGA